MITCSITPCTIEREVALEDGFHCQPCDASDVECSAMSALESNLEQKCPVVESGDVHSEPIVEDCETVAKGNGLSGDDGCMDLENSTSTIPPNAKLQENFGVEVEEDCSSENSSATRSFTDIIRKALSSYGYFC